MTEDAQIEELAQIAAQINEHADQLNEKIEAFEERLKKTHLGIVVWIPLAGLPGRPARMGYMRFGNVWRVMVEITLEDGRTALQPLVKMSRVLRLEAWDRLPELIPALKQAALAMDRRLEEILAP